MPDRKPYADAIVHRKSSAGCLAAIITRVWPDDTVDITVFPPLAEFRSALRLPEGDEDGAWHWLDKEIP